MRKRRWKRGKKRTGKNRDGRIARAAASLIRDLSVLEPRTTLLDWDRSKLSKNPIGRRQERNATERVEEERRRGLGGDRRADVRSNVLTSCFYNLV